MRDFIKQFFRHSIVGGTAFLIDYGLMIAFTEIAGLYYLWSAILSFVISIIVNYVFSMRFVFKGRKDMPKQLEFVIFLSLSSVGLAMNTILLWYLVTYTSMHYTIAKILATFLVTIYNFFSRRRLLDDQEMVEERSLT